MAVIFIIIAILFLILLGWMWNNLGNIENSTKITCIIGGLVIVYIMTFIIYNISKIGIAYESKDAMKMIRTVFVMIFTIINGYIILPYIFKKLDQVNNEEIEKERFKKSIIIILIIVVVLAIFECIYFGDIQQGILQRGNL